MEIKVSEMLLCSNTPELKAVATIVLDGGFAVHGIKIVQSGERLFVVMPDKLAGNGNYYDVAHPINAETRRLMVKAIFAEYKIKVAEGVPE